MGCSESSERGAPLPPRVITPPRTPPLLQSSTNPTPRSPNRPTPTTRPTIAASLRVTGGSVGMPVERQFSALELSPSPLVMQKPKDGVYFTPIDPTDRFVVEMTCSVCMELYTNPRVITPCGHMFCLGCLEKLVKCPECRVAISGRKEINRKLQNLLNSTEGSCTVCDWEGTFETFLESHRYEAHKEEDGSSTTPSGAASSTTSPITLTFAQFHGGVQHQISSTLPDSSKSAISAVFQVLANTVSFDVALTAYQRYALLAGNGSAGHFPPIPQTALVLNPYNAYECCHQLGWLRTNSDDIVELFRTHKLAPSTDFITVSGTIERSSADGGTRPGYVITLPQLLHWASIRTDLWDMSALATHYALQLSQFESVLGWLSSGRHHGALLNMADTRSCIAMVFELQRGCPPTEAQINSIVQNVISIGEGLDTDSPHHGSMKKTLMRGRDAQVCLHGLARSSFVADHVLRATRDATNSLRHGSSAASGGLPLVLLVGSNSPSSINSLPTTTTTTTTTPTTTTNTPSDITTTTSSSAAFTTPSNSVMTMTGAPRVVEHLRPHQHQQQEMDASSLLGMGVSQDEPEHRNNAPPEPPLDEMAGVSISNISFALQQHQQPTTGHRARRTRREGSASSKQQAFGSSTEEEECSADSSFPSVVTPPRSRFAGIIADARRRPTRKLKGNVCSHSDSTQ